MIVTSDPRDDLGRGNAREYGLRRRHARVVLFGGDGYGDTWTWDGTDWTKRTPAHSPSIREAHAMAYDVASGQVLFGGGGYGYPPYQGDTWTWDGTDWKIPFPASLKRTPSSGPPGTVVSVRGWGFGGRRRRAEVLSLRWGDLDLEEGTYVYVGKGGKAQRRPLLPVLRDETVGYAEQWALSREPEAFVFPGRYADQPVSPQLVARHLQLVANGDGNVSAQARGSRRSVGAAARAATRRGLGQGRSRVDVPHALTGPWRLEDS